MEHLYSARLPAPPFDGGPVVVRRPPDVPKDPPSNVVGKLLPVVMLLAMAGMTVLYFTSGVASSRSPAFLFLPVMMLVSVLGSVAYQSRGARRGGELDEDRRAYLRYLDGVAADLTRTAVAQHISLHWSHVDPASSWTLIGGPRMWERRPGDADFCQARVGIGARPLATAVVPPELGDDDTRDPVTAEAIERLVAERSTVPDVPITVDLRAHPRIAVEGPPDAARGLVRAVVCQLAVLHGPDAVRVSAVGALADRYWDWLKWLPHHRHSASPHPPIHCVVIVDGEVVGARLHGGDGVTVLVIAQPSGERLRLDVEGADAWDRPDSLTTAQAVACARRLAACRPGTAGTGTAWAGLVGVGDPAHPDVGEAWRPRSGPRRLRVAIGTSDAGEPVELDLKEAARGGMGPHGLCIGATGSGKSEFLRTLALGLVSTHGPDALNLVLIDFKGGATFLGFDRLRHVAAVVTNLSEEAHLVARMQDALTGEMMRRQRVLRDAGHLPNVDAYDSARAGRPDLAPLPALFVIVDEFSELLSQHPDFAELFVAIGRVGRSLGMHLLLASQRLDEGRLRGVETHLSYRICLKTFSAGESRAVLGTTDAYELPGAPGAAVLKTASGELVRFQTAFVSGPVAPDANPRSPGPCLFTARPECPPAGSDVSGGGSRTLLDVVVEGLADRGRPAHRVWLPPLDGSPSLSALLGERVRCHPRLVVPMGLVDNPFAQRHDTLLVDLRDAGGNVAIVGGPRSGKTTALLSLVAGLASTHDPDTVHVYGLDFGGGSSSLRHLPHVGAMAGRADRDLARRIVAHVQGVLRDRETRRRLGDNRFGGDTFLVIDGWAVARQEFEGMEEAITAIAAQGLSVGVHVVLTASRWADIRPALKDHLGTRVELCLGDPADSEMDRKRARLLGVRPAGHGITSAGLEFVVARPDDVDATALAARHPGRLAPAVRLLPTRVPHDEVVATSPGDLTIGIDEHALAPVAMDFAVSPHLLILGDTECGKTATLRVLCREIMRTNDSAAASLLVVDFRRTLLGVVESDHLLGYAMSAASAESHVAATVRLLTGRLPGEHVTQGQLRDRTWWSGPDVYVIVDDYDLVAGTSGNPLLPLLDLLPHARDLGLHVVIARRSGGAARAMFDPILARLKDLGCTGLMMSAGPDEGVLLGSVRPSPLPAGRGTLIRRGQADRLIQVSWSPPS
ncbi:type VII secretion protein EccC [Mycobacterium antarcticum]|uniref:type VII secretion protein EccCa n=1 Tax=Mycolicibacterium sp. TUM20983 TaxID=3023369 RepID=UPI0023889DD3|nr:type VII secretion protein EccCa [Mycolicibacterium sp. TUM20983]GLP77265.1 type VII secretion protein EccC [Mycolicibacterium sp. TUM20983]